MGLLNVAPRGDTSATNNIYIYIYNDLRIVVRFSYRLDNPSSNQLTALNRSDEDSNVRTTTLDSIKY